MPPNILWYDFETSGTDPVLDRALQFAAVRTDTNLDVLEAPVNILCRPGDDCIPDPEAIAVTGISMNQVVQEGLSEFAFCKKILDTIMVPETCVAGYNSIRFDDEFLRQMLYRNFFEPYTREWQGGNSRWDIIDLVRTAYALRPDGVNWPRDDEGTVTFRLEKLTAANGIDHGHAHDAVADVLATIAMAKRIREAQPRLYDYLYNLRQKRAVVDLLYPLGKTPLVHISSMYPAARGCAALVLPLCQHPTNNNGVVCVDLSADPAPLIAASPDEINRLLYIRNDDLAEGETRMPLKTIHVNRCPALATARTLSADRAVELGIDLDACERNKVRLQQTAGLVERVTAALDRPHPGRDEDADFMLYGGGFLSRDDIALMSDVRDTEGLDLPALFGRFQDDRMNTLLPRFQARNWPASLDAAALAEWRAFWRDRSSARLQENLARIAAMPDDTVTPAIDDLAGYLESLNARMAT